MKREKIPLRDLVPIIIIALLLLFGLLMVYDSSSAQALLNFKDKYYFLKEQIKWVTIGSLGGLAAAYFDYRELRRLALPILVGSILLLLTVFVPGLSVQAYGAHRWINLGVMVLQPSEIAKLSLIIYLSAWLTNREKGRLWSFLLLIGLIVGLIIAEPDLGTALVLLCTSMLVYFLSDNPLRELLLILPLGLVLAIGAAVHSSYRLRRVLTFLDPNSDPLGASYHIRQILISLGSGGLLGLGLGNSRQKYAYLPEANTDSIFAIIGEELGFIGTALIVLIFAYLYYRCLMLTVKVEDPFGRLLGMGIIFWLTIQTIINLASMVALTPLTGVPLPFISYGGSALVVELLGVGILVNIWQQNLKRK